MDVTRTEDEQLAALKKWWSKNGVSVIGGIILGLVAIFGWRGWQIHQLAQAEAASTLYEQIVVNLRQNNHDEARKPANALLADYKSSSYASFAALLLAKLDVEKENYQEALSHLDWVLEYADQEALKHIARIRMARVQLAMDQPEQALATLDVKSTGKFTATYEELKGDIYIALDKIDLARTAYQLALAETGNPASNNTYLQMKLDDIGRSTP